MYKVESLDMDIDPAYLTMIAGGNGDLYIRIHDRTGMHAVRICYAGGYDKEEGIRKAVLNLYKEIKKLEDNGEDSTTGNFNEVTYKIK